MKALAREISMTRAFWTRAFCPRTFCPRTFCLGAALWVLAAPTMSPAAQPCAGAPSVLPPDLASRAEQADDYPTFCAIPATPTDVRDAAAFRREVVATRLAGARLVRMTAPETFSITGTDAFVAGARREAAPPPPITTPGEADTAAFVKASRARATPPPRPH